MEHLTQFVVVIKLFVLILKLIKLSEAHDNQRKAATAGHGNSQTVPWAPQKLPFAWKSRAGLFNYFFSKYQWAVDYNELFFKAYVRPMAGREELVRELYLDAQRSKAGQKVYQFLQAIHFWYDKKASNSILDWRPRKQDFSSLNAYNQALAAFLFEQQPVPAYFANIWTDHHNAGWQEFNRLLSEKTWNEKSLNTPAFQLYFYLTQGGSPAKAPFTGWEMGRAAARHFLETPQGYSPRQAYWRALLLAEGGERVVEAWSRQGFAAPSHFGHTAFWRDFYRLIIREKTTPGNYAVQSLIDKIAYLYLGAPHYDYQLEESYFPAEKLTFKRHGWKSLVRFVNGQFRFKLPEGMQRQLTQTTAEGEQYTFVFLDTPAALEEEGRLMNHCLGSGGYIDMALNGEGSIWSLRKKLPTGEETRVATLTIYQNDIEELQGFNNSEVDGAIWLMTQQWLRSPALVTA